ncbi:SUMF1/EgtB/PvdO family nonheme iron enzyme [Nonomuraea sp. K274]|uniref:SUMF1/EgtB/PvdO family nonheme iron enzyme n=1 Tax=Nonomuraea cypriaca TaxID=1187855 RepID=A0A931A8D4_9ACTN|nr:SUMF1/EgtB/PvdO family nonheme iron enzyme [Nonomuraea cypriaca]MBF8185324.1 SUMF1/EgtB/PvdO family nonheme iron enzyme [Nonomuraea cypriaca]
MSEKSAGALKVYVSSTVRDLGAYRDGVIHAIRRLGCHCVAMEDYGADTMPPIERCVTDVASCDLYVGIVAWSYGFTPPGHEESFVAEEYQAAIRNDIPTLIFLLKDDHPWPPKLIDRGEPGRRLEEFRAKLQRTGLVEFFTVVDDLTARVSAAVARHALRRRMLSSPSRVDTGTLEAYQQWAIDRHGYIEMVGVGSQEYFFPLGEVFVVPELRTVRPGQPSGSEDHTHNVTIDGILRLDEAMQGVVVFGEPGAGKTTVLAHLLATTLLHGGSVFGLDVDTVPILVPLRHLTAEAMRRPLAEFVEAELAAAAPGRFPDDFVRQLWRRGRLLLLLDGIDEAGAASSRAAMIAYLRGQAHGLRARKITLVASCRTAARVDAVKLGPRFSFFEVRPLPDTKITEFIRRWFHAAQRFTESGGASLATDWSLLGDELAQSLVSRSVANHRFAVLASSPLILSLLCVIALRGGEVPHSEVDFYRECLRTLLGRWARAKGIEPPLSAADAHTILRLLAVHLHNAGERDFDAEEFERITATPIVKLRTADGRVTDPKSVLEWLHHGAGVLTSPSTETYSFSHLTFQEYLTASHLADNSRELVRAATHLGEKWWREVLLFTVQLASRETAAQFFAAALTPPLVERSHAALRQCVETVTSLNTLPFVRFLEDPAVPAGAKAHVLRMFVNHPDHEISRVARSLSRHDSPEVSALAIRIREKAAESATARATTVMNPEEPIVEPFTGILLRPIPAGQFTMGADDIGVAEQPEHLVRVSSFWLAETTVTNRHYELFLKATQHSEPAFWREPMFAGPDLPVVGVNWYDATEFCRWLATLSRLPFTLPSEAQWEYAARGTDGRRYPWGSEPPDRTRACYYEGQIDSHPEPVGSFPLGRGPFGCMDQAGNVWEWCLDVWDPDAYSARLDQVTVDPVVSTGNASMRVLRGGNWWFTIEGLDAAYRFRNPVDNRNDDIGFRVALNPQ